MNFRNGLVIAFGIVALFPGAGRAGDLKVVATTPDYGALAMAIGGDKIAIKTLAKPGEDPHFVDARPSHVVTLNRADLLIESGADLEIGWLPALVQGSRNKKILPGEPGRFLGAEGVLDDAHCHQLLAVVAAVHHERIREALDNRTLCLPEPLDIVAAGGVR